MGDAQVSLTDILDVRANGLNFDELLSVLLKSCEFFNNRRKTENFIQNGIAITQQRKSFGGLFSPNSVFLSRNGKILIKPESLSLTPQEFVPPELRDSDVKCFEIGDPQLVWCLGEIGVHSAQSDFSDVGLFSLFNLMTVETITNRPTLLKLEQMLKNKVSKPERIPTILSSLFEELMGDIDELIDDKFCDDIRFSSARSSLSIISGAFRRSNQNNASIVSSRADAAHRLDLALKQLRNKKSNITDYVRTVVDSNEEINSDGDDTDHVVSSLSSRNVTPTPDPPFNDNGQYQFHQFHKESLSKMFVPNTFSEKQLNNNNITTAQSAKNFALSDDNDGGNSRQFHSDSNSLKNFESVKVEVHLSPEKKLVDPKVMNSAVLFNNSNVVSARKRSSLLSNEPQKKITSNQIDKFLYGSDTIELYNEEPKNLASSFYDDGSASNAAFEASPNLSKRHNLASYSLPEVINSANQVTDSALSTSFSRQNSLQPSKICRHSQDQNNDQRQKSNDTSADVQSVNALNFAVPEFLEKSVMPLIRLRAQCKKKKKITMYRLENALVFVKLLTGQCIEVYCRTDALVLNIFETVAAHLNITEHLFFGLALLKDSEYFFLDGERRLEKWAPPGWKNSAAHAALRTNSSSTLVLPQHYSPSTATVQRLVSSLSPALVNSNDGTDYCLHLRFQYYPKKVEFIKTEATSHNLYLQLRQDILDCVLRFSDYVNACELAALALQAEFGNAPTGKTAVPNILYFKFDNYLPANFYATAESNVASAELEVEICRRHVCLMGMSRCEAERSFISYCQSALGYGAHYYCVSKIKPSLTSGHQSSFIRFSDVHRLAIMPLGIAICREQTTTGARHVQAAYEWNVIRTLQYDRKRLLIATVKDAVGTDHVFYTDHYSKSSYLVRFAAAQHRFMMKMRHWQFTLNRVKGDNLKETLVDKGIRAVDVGILTPTKIENQFTNTAMNKYQSVGDEENPKVKIDKYKKSNQVDNDVNQIPENFADLISFNQNESEVKNLLSKIDTDYIRYCYGSEAEKLNVILEKHPRTGLGLTLVDGSVNGVKGVYVKSVSNEGDGKRKGLNIGDCLLSINKTSLLNKSRHDAVELVKLCNGVVEVEILRFPSITEVLAASTTNELDENKLSILNFSGGITKATPNANARRFNDSFALEQKLGLEGKKLLENAENLNRYCSLNRKKSAIVSGASLAPQLKRYNQRAVSDFGAIGDNLPVLNSDDLIVGTMQRKRNNSISDDSEDSVDTIEKNVAPSTSSARTLRRGKYNVGVDNMYNTFLNDDDHQDKFRLNSETENNSDEDNGSILKSNGGLGLCQQKQRFQGGNGGNFCDFDTISWTTKYDTSTLSSYKSATLSSGTKQGISQQQKNRRKNTLDWTNDLSDIDDGDNNSDGDNSDGYKQSEVLNVVIQRAFVGQPLGFQIGSATPDENATIFAIKQITSMPAAVANIKINDIILTINGTSIAGLSHAKVVELLCSTSADLNVKLKVKRLLNSKIFNNRTKEAEEREETICATLDKSQCRSIGLSLAKRMGHEGIFIRNIAPGSLAFEQGSGKLRVGDRIWTINGEVVANKSSTEIVQRLSQIDSVFEICVKRITRLVVSNN